MRTVNYSTRFKKDVKLAADRGYKTIKLYEVMKAFEHEEVLAAKYKEHPLIGS